MSDELVERIVASLYVQCMFQVRNFKQPAIAASDCCLMPANYAVKFPNGSRYWRCFDHRDMLDYSRKGEFSETVTVRKDR